MIHGKSVGEEWFMNSFILGSSACKAHWVKAILELRICVLSEMDSPFSPVNKTWQGSSPLGLPQRHPGPAWPGMSISLQMHNAELTHSQTISEGHAGKGPSSTELALFYLSIRKGSSYGVNKAGKGR